VLITQSRGEEIISSSWINKIPGWEREGEEGGVGRRGGGGE